jgi:uncharacterized protein YrrD
MADPVSWFLIEQGWSVQAIDGTELGTVEDVLGDQNADIFSGLAVKSGLLGKVKQLPAERVGEIREGTIVVDLDQASFDALDEHVSDASVQ